MHERVDEPGTEVRDDIRIARGLRLRSLRLGLSGIADVVEFHRVPEGEMGAPLDHVKGLWRPFPVEYKRGQLRSEESFEVQLCAQALCLEEMLNIEVACGALYYGKTRRRLEIPFHKDIRERTEAAARRLHVLVEASVTPTAQPEAKCHFCSLHGVCLPEATDGRKSVKAYLKRATAPMEAAP